jgi:hypothetical protein
MTIVMRGFGLDQGANVQYVSDFDILAVVDDSLEVSIEGSDSLAVDVDTVLELTTTVVEIY